MRICSHQNNSLEKNHLERISACFQKVMPQRKNLLKLETWLKKEILIWLEKMLNQISQL